ncbi:MAG: hypothetical protein Q4C70_12385 [Planctomycetia bacterium]|nr:hypothetical protein [Planctomycetia bacterium]
MKKLILVMFCVLFGSFIFSVSLLVAYEWTDRNGNTINATFVRLSKDGKTVFLKRGKRVGEYNVDDFCDKDREHFHKMYAKKHKKKADDTQSEAVAKSKTKVLSENDYGIPATMKQATVIFNVIMDCNDETSYIPSKLETVAESIMLKIDLPFNIVSHALKMYTTILNDPARTSPIDEDTIFEDCFALATRIEATDVAQNLHWLMGNDMKAGTAAYKLKEKLKRVDYDINKLSADEIELLQNRGALQEGFAGSERALVASWDTPSLDDTIELEDRYTSTGISQLALAVSKKNFEEDIVPRYRERAVGVAEQGAKLLGGTAEEVADLVLRLHGAGFEQQDVARILTTGPTDFQKERIRDTLGDATLATITGYASTYGGLNDDAKKSAYDSIFKTSSSWYTDDKERNSHILAGRQVSQYSWLQKFREGYRTMLTPIVLPFLDNPTSKFLVGEADGNWKTFINGVKQDDSLSSAQMKWLKRNKEFVILASSDEFTRSPIEIFRSLVNADKDGNLNEKLKEKLKEATGKDFETIDDLCDYMRQLSMENKQEEN